MNSQVLHYVINHLFLPPQLPQEDDSGDIDSQAALLLHISESATAFAEGLSNTDVGTSVTPCWQILQKMLQSMHRIHENTHMSLAELQRTVENMEVQDVLCLHISAQNTGVILRKFETETTLEFFQASPTAASVTGNIGKLIVQFPSQPRLSVPNDPELMASLCVYLAELSHTVMPDAVPVTKKAGSNEQEHREVPDTRYISQFLGGIARALTVDADAIASGTVYVTKRLNDHVYWKSARLPWRRAPKWLILRVALQTTLAQWKVDDIYGYKVFVTFVLARALEKACKVDIPDHVLFAMNSKIGTRVHKLQSLDIVPFAMDYIATQVRFTRSLLDSRWQAIQDIEAQPSTWLPPTRCEIEEGQQFTLSRSRPYLSEVLNRTRGLQQAENQFSPAAFEASLLKGHIVRTMRQSPPLPIPEDSTDPFFWLAILDQESWVVNGMEEWLQSASPSEQLGTLREMIARHEDLALEFTSINPELFSRLFLTLMELWVGLDTTAIKLLPLLADYSPELTVRLLEPLILPELSQLKRLRDVERYLTTRHDNAKYHQFSLFSVSEDACSFSARYFSGDSGLQALRTEIQQKASASKEAALQEWKIKNDKYHQLREEADPLSCDSVQRWDRDGFIETYHSFNCIKCAKLEEAKNLTVPVFEWPLPESEFLSRLVVFELRLPGPFGLWRDVTYGLARTYSTVSLTNDLSPTPILSDYPTLQPYFIPNQPTSRLTIASTAKSFLVSHYNPRKASCEAEDVIKRHPLRYAMYDEDLSEWPLPSLFPAISIRNHCTPTFPRCPYTNLGWTLSATTHTPNEVIASQSMCPVELSYHEWDAFGHLRSGLRLQWRNMMLQLVTGTMTLSDPVVYLLFRQAIWQAESPSEAENPYREAHSDLAKKSFGMEVLTVLETRLGIICENWQEGWTAATLSVVACRLLSLTQFSGIKDRVITFLKSLRDTVWVWITQVLRLLIQKNATTALESGLRNRVLQLSATCRSTYAIAPGFPSLFKDPKDVFMFIRCAIVIQSHLPVNLRQLSEPLRYLLERDTLLSAELLDGLTEAICGDEAGLDDAIHDIWHGFRRDSESPWKRIHDQWMACTTSAHAARQSCFVHLNLLDGTLTVDGKPLGHLPRDIVQHSLFSTLFPNQGLIEATPSTMKGMTYQLRQNIGDFEVHFLLAASDLIVRTWDNLEHSVSEFVPAEKLLGDIPDVLLFEMVHRYNELSQSLDFYPAHSGWQPHAVCAWSLHFKIHRGIWEPKLSRITADDVVENVLRPDCQAVRQLSAIFHALEVKQSNLLVLWHQQTPTTNYQGHYGGDHLGISLPRYKLSFSVGLGGILACEELPGLSVSPVQSVGSLFGLRNKLILQSHDSNGVQKIIIPDGDIQVAQRTGGHKVTISTKSSLSHVNSFVYDVDDIVGRIVGDGTLTSWYLLAYLHILTSSHLLDPLLRRTGVQQALDMLESANSFAFMQLTSEHKHLLQCISKLTPVRTYYPRHLKSMETVQWHPILSPLVQSDLFVPHVQAILDFGETQALFVSHQGLDDSNDKFQYELEGVGALRERAEFRNARYLPSKSTGRHVADYCMLDHFPPALQDKGSRVSEIATMVINWPKSLNTIDQLWAQYRKWGKFSTQVTNVKLNNPRTWLLNTPSEARSTEAWFSEAWFSFLSLCGEGARIGRYELMLALGILTFRSDVDSGLVRALLVAAINIRSTQLQQAIGLLPVGNNFDLGPGHIMKLEHIRSVADTCCIPYESSDQAQLTRLQGESKDALKSRRVLAYNSKCVELCGSIADLVFKMWPSSTVDWPANISRYTLIDLPSFKQRVESLFSSRFLNHRLFEHSQKLQAVFDTVQQPRQADLKFPVRMPPRIVVPSPRYSHMTLSSLINCRDPPTLPDSPIPLSSSPAITTTVDMGPTCDASSNRVRKKKPLSTRDVLARLCNEQESGFLQCYARDLGKCVDALEDRLSDNYLGIDSHHDGYSSSISLQTMEDILQPRDISERIRSDAGQWPCLGPESLLRQLSFDLRRELSENWLIYLVLYAEGLAAQQQRRRLSQLSCLGHEVEYAKEAENRGGRGWDGMAYPDWLLVQIDANILIRPVQISIAKEMMAPACQTNAVMQLNMGEGKSSVIVPIISAALANGKQLVRVLVLKPLCTQMFHLLKHRLCGLSNRRLFYLPFSRDIPMTSSVIRQILGLFKTCAKVGGILLSQPEHLLSFQLTGLYNFCTTRDEDETRLLLDAKQWLDENARDILDESDEILSVKYQLIYTIGVPSPMDGQPDRWRVLQDVFSLLRGNLLRVVAERPNDLEVEQTGDQRFPRTRIYTKECGQDLLTSLAHQIVFEDQIPSISFRNYPRPMQDLAFHFLTKIEFTARDSRSLKDYSGRFFSHMLLLRGLIVHGILLLSLKEKRWRVDYGLDTSRSMLAVPYRAKDSPACRAEFGHPDMILTLTCLSYYYGGLSDHQLETTFHSLFNSDNPALRYEEWIKGSLAVLPESLHHLQGLNLDDAEQKQLHIFPRLRYNKAVIDFYLSECVFPKEAREFQYKLTTNAWDIGCTKANLTTGFSGTNDNRYLLPLSIHQADFEAQRHTNAHVLEYLLRDENRTVICTESCTTLGLIQLVVRQEPHVMVLLDVGAQILELQNEDVAREWLNLDTHTTVQAAIYFDPKTDEPYVLSRDGRIESLTSSLYKLQLDKVLVYLDEAHTRGTDFRFPAKTRAVVTLGPKMAKDKLVQGCMRMRKLGSGHSVLFFASREIWTKIQTGSYAASLDRLDSSNVLEWAMRETCTQIKDNSALWANQGLNFDMRHKAWEEYKAQVLSADKLSEVLQEQESRTLEELYDVRNENRFDSGENGRPSEREQAIRNRCREFGILSFGGGALLEEQERELAHEKEDERQVERLLTATPLRHHVDPALISFIQFGAISTSFISIQDCLRNTSTPPLAGLFRSKNLRATIDFYDTISIPNSPRPSGVMNNFLRVVQWILSNVQSTMYLLISPFEANELLPQIRKSNCAFLHLYAPRVSRNTQSFEDMQFFTVPGPRLGLPTYSSAMHELNLFAGQLFLLDRKSFEGFCHLLGLHLGAIPDVYKGDVDAGGYVKRARARTALRNWKCTIKTSPLAYLTELIGWRRKGQGFALTHVGQIIHGNNVDISEFAEEV